MYTNIKNNFFFNEALKKLKEKKLDALGNIKAIAEHQKPLALSYALCALDKYKLLTSENRNQLKTKEQPQNISNALDAIGYKLATQENLNILLSLKNNDFLEHSGYLLYRIPENKFNQIVFDRIIKLANEENSTGEIYIFINKILRGEIQHLENSNSLANKLPLENDISKPRLTR